ncbi:hypothetical protein RJ641_030348, partial [Dillenia turbinata]
EVLLGNSVVDAIDQAVSKYVGIVILNGGDGSGGKLYEAACLLKSVIRDRAYLMISERVDIAAAVNASGVVLSDQGLPAWLGYNDGFKNIVHAKFYETYLEDGVVPTTSEIKFLSYSKLDSVEQQRCERHPDGQLICYLPAPILKESVIYMLPMVAGESLEALPDKSNCTGALQIKTFNGMPFLMNIVDTPGTNRLSGELVPCADLLLFVISAGRPLTESEVAFLRYTQQWKKKVVFVLKKTDLYQNASEVQSCFLVLWSIQSALQAKLSASSDAGENNIELLITTSGGSHSFKELETFLYGFLDGSTSTGMERLKLKLETPVSIAERLLSACETLVRQEHRYAKQDLTSIEELMSSVKQYAVKMESESLSWRREVLSLIESAKSRVLKLIESTVRLSNLDIAASYVFKGGNSSLLPATSRIENDIIGPAVSDAQKLLVDYLTWL